MKCSVVLDSCRKGKHYFDTLFTKTAEILLFSINKSKFNTLRKHNMQICSILLNEHKFLGYRYQKPTFCSSRTVGLGSITGRRKRRTHGRSR